MLPFDTKCIKKCFKKLLRFTLLTLKNVALNTFGTQICMYK